MGLRIMLVDLVQRSAATQCYHVNWVNSCNGFAPYRLSLVLLLFDKNNVCCYTVLNFNQFVIRNFSTKEPFTWQKCYRFTHNCCVQEEFITENNFR